MSEPLRWERLGDPPKHVMRVRVVGSDEVWTRMEREGYYWSSRGYPEGIGWNQLRRWGDLEEVPGE